MIFTTRRGKSDLEPKVAVYHFPPPHLASVEYHVLHSTSYRVPVLYFFFHNLPPSISQSVNYVYEHLVPQQLQSELKSVGVLGGIGMTVCSLEVLAPSF